MTKLNKSQSEQQGENKEKQKSYLRKLIGNSGFQIIEEPKKEE